MRKLLFLLFSLLFAGVIHAQIDTLNHLKFETTNFPWSFSSNPSTYDVGTDNWGNFTNIGNSPDNIVPNSPNNLWGMRDLDNPNGGGDFYHELILSTIDISAYSTEDVELSFWYATFEFDMANGDTIGYQVEYDNGTTWTSPIITLNPNTNAIWEQEVIDVPLGEDFVRIRLLARQDGGGDWAGFDDIVLYKQSNIPVYDIETVSADADNDFVPDSLGVVCELRGTVHGVDLQGGASNLQFTLIDNTGGIGVINFGNAFGYTVSEGDSVHLQGEIEQFNGLTQIDLDTVIFISPNGSVRQPMTVSALDESTESQIIRLDSVYLADPLQWQTSGSFNIDITNGVDTMTMRIDSDTDIDGSATPMGAFNISGIGGQFDGGSPADGGYQLLPRYTEDFEFILPISVKEANCGAPVLQIAYTGMGILWNNTAASTADTAEYTADGAVNVTVDASYGASISFGNATAVGDTSITVGVAVGGSITLPSDTVCANTSESYTVGPNVNPPGTTYDWDFGGVGNASGFSANFTFPNTGTFVVELLVTDPSGNCTSTSTETIEVEDCSINPVIPSYQIGIVTNDSDADGLPDSLGVKCELTGVVYGIDLQGGASNLQFTIIDATGGIGVISFGSTFGYTVNEGDLVRVVGTVDEFRGLAQLEDLDTIEVVGTNQTLNLPAVVTGLDESTESEFIEIRGLTFIDTADWDGTGSSFNIDATNGVDTFTVRIDNDVDLADLALGFDYTFNLVGIGGQFTFDTPPTNGYQVLPRSSADFTFHLPISVKSDGCDGLVLEIPYNGPSISWSTGSDADTTLVTATGNISVQVSDFGANSNFGFASAEADTNIASLPAGITFTSFDGFPGTTICTNEAYTIGFAGSNATSYSWDFGEGAAPIVNSDTSFTYTYLSAGTYTVEIILSDGNCSTTETFSITVADNNCTSGRNDYSFGELSIYPNPAQDRVNIETTAELEQVQLLDLQGRALNSVTVVRTPAGYELQLADVASGLYLLQLRTTNAQTTLKLQVR